MAQKTTGALVFDERTDRYDISYSPSYILLFPFLLGYVYIVLSVSQNNSYIYIC